MKICGRCDQTIKPGEPHTEHDIHAPTGPGSTVHWHLACPSK
jgi:hypothetical protein